MGWLDHQTKQESKTTSLAITFPYQVTWRIPVRIRGPRLPSFILELRQLRRPAFGIRHIGLNSLRQRRLDICNSRGQRRPGGASDVPPRLALPGCICFVGTARQRPRGNLCNFCFQFVVVR